MTTTWEGFDLTPAHRRWRFWIAQGRDELPATRASSEVVPFRRGRLHKPGLADTRRLELRGYIQEATLAGLLTARDEIKRLLAPTVATPGTLTDAWEDGSTRSLRAIPRTASASYGGNATRLYSIELEALDPYWYGPGGLAMDSGHEIDEGLTLDAGEETVVVPTSAAHALTLEHAGNAPVDRVTVVFEGASSAAPGVENLSLEGPVGFVMTNALAAGQALVVDNDARTVLLGLISKRGEMTLRSGNAHGEYFRLRPGANQLRILGRPAKVRIRHTTTHW